MKCRINKKRNTLVKMKFSAFENDENEKNHVNYYNSKEEKPMVVMQSCCAISRFAKNEK